VQTVQRPRDAWSYRIYVIMNLIFVPQMCCHEKLKAGMRRRGEKYCSSEPSTGSRKTTAHYYYKSHLFYIKKGTTFCVVLPRSSVQVHRRFGETHCRRYVSHRRQGASSKVERITILNYIFWDISPCSPLKVNRRLGGTYRIHPEE
jgi:hypothetical protein